MQALVNKKGGFSASPIYTNLRTMCITDSAVLTTHRIQLEQEAKEKNENLQKNINVWIKNIQAAIKENTKRLKAEELKVADLKNLLIYVLTASESSDKPSIYTNKTEILNRLEALEKCGGGIFKRTQLKRRLSKICLRRRLRFPT